MCGLRQNGFQFPLQFSNRYLFVTYIWVLKKAIQKSIFNLRQPFLIGSSLACFLVFSFLLCCFLNYVKISPFTEIFSNFQPTIERNEKYEKFLTCWSYFDRNVLGHNRTKVWRFKSLTFFSSTMSDLQLGLRKIENVPLKSIFGLCLDWCPE